MGESRDSAPLLTVAPVRYVLKTSVERCYESTTPGFSVFVVGERAATEGGESTDDPTEPDVNHVLKGVEKAGRQSGYPEKSSESARR